MKGKLGCVESVVRLRLGVNRVDSAAVERMVSTMFSRGPDGSGLVARGKVVFGHRRLKIIDLSEAAQQPMVDSDLGPFNYIQWRNL